MQLAYACDAKHMMLTRVRLAAPRGGCTVSSLRIFRVWIILPNPTVWVCPVLSLILAQELIREDHAGALCLQRAAELVRYEIGELCSMAHMREGKPSEVAIGLRMVWLVAACEVKEKRRVDSISPTGWVRDNAYRFLWVSWGA
jgi:hypothetical protein